MSTIVTGGPTNNIIDLSGIDEDYDLGEYRKLTSIQFVPGAAADVLVVKDVDADGPRVLEVEADGASDETIKYFYGDQVHVYIDHSECTLSAGHAVIIMAQARS
ncbi:MAG: hypothetical protein SVM79_00045 [Chloroflexota bacterium]|nr:hypothetical protein [Chloroflexota bacterium]